jgi:hypothetical protein
MSVHSIATPDFNNLLIVCSELYKEFLVPFSFFENYFTPNQFERFYMDNLSEEESVSPNRRDKGGASYEHFVSPGNSRKKKKAREILYKAH